MNISKCINNTTNLYFFLGKPVVVITQIVQVDAFWVVTRHTADEIVAVLGGAKGGPQQVVLVQPVAVQCLNRRFGVLFIREGHVHTDGGVRVAVRAMNHHFTDLAVLAEILGFSEHLFIREGGGHADDVD